MKNNAVLVLLIVALLSIVDSAAAGPAYYSVAAGAFNTTEFGTGVPVDLASPSAQ